MTSYSQKHIHIVADELPLFEELRASAKEYNFCIDPSGKFLEEENDRNGFIHAIDLIITGSQRFLEEFNSRKTPIKREFEHPFIVLVDPDNLESFSQANLNLHCYPVFYPYTIGVLQAVIKTALKNQERINALEEKERYKILFQSGPIIQLLIKPESGQIIDANQAAANLYGITEEKLIGKDIRALHPQCNGCFKDFFEKILQKNEASICLKFVDQSQNLIDLCFLASKIIIGNRTLIFLKVQDITEKVKADELMHQQHEMLRSTISSIDDLFFTLNSDGEFIDYYQPTHNKQLSLSSDLFVGKSISEVGFPEKVAKKYLNTIKKVIQSGHTEQIDYCLEAFGTELWYNAKISPRHNNVNIAEGVTVICRDVTRQKKAEENLIRARDFYLTLLKDFPSMIWKTNSSKKTDYFNKTWLEFTGRSLQEEIDKDWLEKLHIEDAPKFLSSLDEAYAQHKPFQIEHRLLDKNKQYRWVLNVGRPFKNLEGDFAGFIGSCYDITERRNSEDLLRIQRRAIESALEGILIMDATRAGNPVIYANKELSAITGIEQEKITGKDFLEVIGNPEDEKITRNIEKAIQDRENFKGEFFFLDPAGKENWRMVLTSPVKDRKGNVSHFVAVLADITDQKLSEKTLKEKNRELQKTNAELDSFVYSTSHELRSPLMSVLGLINLMHMETKSHEEKKYIKMMKESIHKLDQIIHDIIDYSRNSRFEVNNEPINFKACIDKIIEKLKYLPGADKVDWRIRVNGEATFYSDPRRIEIILNNFISNSLKFHKPEGVSPFIAIDVKSKADKAYIQVKDNGSGISKSHLPHIYDMFYRGTEKSNGSGIGLYIVKEIVEKLDGKISVDSDKDKGTSFSVELPNKPINNKS